MCFNSLVLNQEAMQKIQTIEKQDNKTSSNRKVSPVVK
jgi:hypothetical protein